MIPVVIYLLELMGSVDETFIMSICISRMEAYSHQTLKAG